MALEDEVYPALAQGVQGTAHRVLVGLNWTLVEGPHGMGFCHTAPRGRNGCRDLPASGHYGGKRLYDLSQMTSSENPFERSIGFAAINAHYNRFDLGGQPINGLDLVDPSGEKTVVVGRFPDLDTRLPRAMVIERNNDPKYYPEESAEILLPKAENAIITASALSNGSLPRLLNLSRRAFTILVGPSAPFSPVLFDYGVDAVSGFVVSDIQRVVQTVMEGGATRALKKCGQHLTIFRS